MAAKKEKSWKKLSPFSLRRNLMKTKGGQAPAIREPAPDARELPKSPLQQQELRPQRLQNKLVNFIMRHGKKQKAQKIVTEASLYLRREENQDFSLLLQEAVDRSSSPLQLRSRRRGSQKLRVPFPLRSEQQESTGLRRLVKEASSGRGPMARNLALTVLRASQGTGRAVEEQQAHLKEVQRNRGNLFLRW